MARKHVQRHEREYRANGAGRAVGVGEVHSVEGCGAQVKSEHERRWERARAVYESARAAGASSAEAYEAAQAVYQA